MARQQPPSTEPIPSTDIETHTLPVNPMEEALVELETRASVTTAVLQEILAQGDQPHYTRHWGINE